jgi:viroplasmin and RNaseH domain-containing protein
MGQPKTQKNFYAVTRGLNDISGIFKEWNEYSKVVLNSKAAIYQGCILL